jgi:hypothetical protein
MMCHVSRLRALASLVVLGVLFLGVVLTGCGEKITIPQPEGLYSGSPYRVDDEYEDSGQPHAMAIANKALFVLSGESLFKKNTLYENGIIDAGYVQPTALCTNKDGDLLFVYDQATHLLHWMTTLELTPLGQTELLEVQSCNSMATCPVGIEQFPGATTYLYLSDPDSAVVHRYAFDELNGLTPHGILTRSGGDAARFVHHPAGLARDSADSLLVADADTLRNWVIRFVAEPDITDVTPEPDDQDPLRGTAALWGNASGCINHPAGDYVLGKAEECGGGEWIPGTSSDSGEFAGPRGMAVDGSGRIFVADTLNDRIQLFDADGNYLLQFGNPDLTPRPIGVALYDQIIDPANNQVHFGAYVYVLLENESRVVKFISNEQANHENKPPPDDVLP